MATSFGSSDPPDTLGLALAAMSPRYISDDVKPRPVIRLPDPLRNWPWPRFVSPYYDECKRASDAWFRGFNAFSPKAQLAFVKCNFSMEMPSHSLRLRDGN